MLKSLGKSQKNLGSLVQMQQKTRSKRIVSNVFFVKIGGEEGIRTLVRFNPQTDFESAPLWPLRYLSVYTNLDFYPFEAPENGGIFARDATIILNLNPRKSLINQGFPGIRWTIDGRISSAARYNHFDTLPCINIHFWGLITRFRVSPVMTTSIPLRARGSRAAWISIAHIRKKSISFSK